MLPRADLAGHVRDRLVEPGVQAEGQAVARGVDCVEQRVQLPRADSAGRAARGRTPRARCRRWQSISMMVGATNVPCAHTLRAAAALDTAKPLSRMAATWRSMPSRASAEITGPTSVDSRSGLPTASSAIAPFSMASVRSAMSSCRQSTRSAEQRWPAESKADSSTSPTTCSASAEESTISAFWPPVSAMSGIGRAVRAEALRRARVESAARPRSSR